MIVSPAAVRAACISTTIHRLLSVALYTQVQNRLLEAGLRDLEAAEGNLATDESPYQLVRIWRVEGIDPVGALHPRDSGESRQGHSLESST